MLLQMLEENLEAIRGLDVERDAVAFAEQVLARNPAPFRTIPQTTSMVLVGDGPKELPADRLGALLLARAQLQLIAEIPAHVRELWALVEHGQTTPHARAAVLSALAYLVQPAELIDDRSPGGYGYVDDCIVLRTMRLALARMGVPIELDPARELRALSLLALALSPDHFTKMQNLMTRTWNEVHLLHMLPDHVAQTHAHQIEASPLTLSYDWTQPGACITNTPPSLCSGGFGEVDDEGIAIDFVDGGIVHVAPTGDIVSFA
ncbi:MAG: hypothetical protein AB1Z98_25310 [Nannocystaceae bacterium]